MRAEKQLLLDEIKAKIDGSGSFVVTRYENLDSAQMRCIRDEIAGKEAEFEVVPKRVFVKAAEASGLNIDLTALQGHIGIVFAQKDPLEASKYIVKYGANGEKPIEILLGLIDGELCTKEEVETLASLPSQQELRALLVGVLAAPLTQTLGTLNALLTSVPHCLEGKSQKTE